MTRWQRLRRWRNRRKPFGRFLASVLDPQPDDCWIWTRDSHADVPMFVTNGGRIVDAREWCWWITFGRPVAGQLGVRCGQPMCVHPEHLVDSGAP